MHEVWPGGGQDEVPSSARQDAPEPPSESHAAEPAEALEHPEPPEDAAPSSAEAEETAPQGGLTAEGPRPLDVGVRPTGHGEIDAGLRRLADADHLAVSGHLEVYEDVHRGLRSTLTALDQHDSGS